MIDDLGHLEEHSRAVALLPAEERIAWIRRERSAFCPLSTNYPDSMTFKLSRDRHGKLLAAVSKHGLTVTDILTAHVDQIIPVLLKAKPVEVPGYKRDLRTKIPRRREIA